MYYVRVGDQSAVYTGAISWYILYKYFLWKKKKKKKKTGDYNMTPDRHLGAAWIERLRPDLLITETTWASKESDEGQEYILIRVCVCSVCRCMCDSTESRYATTIRDSKRARERNFLKRVHEAVERGGKVRRRGRTGCADDVWL